MADLRALLLEMGARSSKKGVILRSSRKKPWSYAGLANALIAARKGTGVARTFHDLRRTRATQLLSQGLSAGQVALMMGWAEQDVEEMKRTYVDKGEMVRRIVEKMEA
jgi:integrase